jgi:hypothetical protein
MLTTWHIVLSAISFGIPEVFLLVCTFLIGLHTPELAMLPMLLPSSGMNDLSAYMLWKWGFACGIHVRWEGGCWCGWVC